MSPIYFDKSLTSLPSLQPGSTGQDVVTLQKWLVSQGFMSQADMDTGPGVYGPHTKSAVASFQSQYGINTQGNSGYFGSITRSFVTDSVMRQDKRQVSSLKQYGLTDKNQLTQTSSGDWVPAQGAQSSQQITQNQPQKITQNQPQTSNTPPNTQKNATSQSGASYNTGNPTNDALLTAMDGFLNRISQNGTVINPNAPIDPNAVAQFMTMAQNNLSAFMPYANNEIAPYYQSQLAQAKQSFLTSVGYNEQQQLQLEQDLQKTYNQSLKDIGATAADQGFAQSGMRSKQEGDLAYQTNRQVQQGRQTLGQQTTQAAQQFASAYGGGNLPQTNIPAVPSVSSGSAFTAGQGTQPLYNLSDQVYQGITGSQQYQQTADINTRAGALASAFQQQQGVQQQRRLTL